MAKKKAQKIWRCSKKKKNKKKWGHDEKKKKQKYEEMKETEGQRSKMFLRRVYTERE